MVEYLPFGRNRSYTEALDYYRSKGLNSFNIYEKNYSLRNFFNYFLKIFLNKNDKGFKYISLKSFFKNLIYQTHGYL